MLSRRFSSTIVSRAMLFFLLFVTLLGSLMVLVPAQKAAAACKDPSDVTTCGNDPDCTAAGGVWQFQGGTTGSYKCVAAPTDPAKQCSSTNIAACGSEAACTAPGVGGSWQYVVNGTVGTYKCVAAPTDPTKQCAATNFSACTSETPCVGAGGVWAYIMSGTVGSYSCNAPSSDPTKQCNAANQTSCTSNTACSQAGGTWAVSSGTSGVSSCQGTTLNADASCPQDPNGICTNTADAELTCGGGSAFDWLICPVIQAAQKGAQQVDQFITSMLDVDASKIFDTGAIGGKGYYKAWSLFRIIATAILIIGALVMVTSSALGFEILDAYTIRKVLPRLLIAVIGISLSWPIMEFVVRLFDTIGFDIRSLIYSPFKGLAGNINPAVGLGSYLALAGAALALGFASLTFILTALLAIFVGFIVLVIRQLAIIVIIILSPVAIACYILPNTHKVWRLWVDNFLGLMLMFPIISAFIAAGHVFAAVSLAPGASTTGITQIVGIAAYFIPYFLLPMAFKLATGAISTIAGVVNDRGRGAFDRLKKTRQNAMAERGARVNRYATQQRATAVRAMQRRSNNSSSWLGKKALRLGASSVGGYNIEAKASAYQASTSKELEDQIATGYDKSIRGLTVNRKAAKADAWLAANADGSRESATGLRRQNKDGSVEYKSLGGAWIDEASVEDGHKRWGGNHFAQQQALAYEGRKAMDEGQVEDFSARYTSLAKQEWRMSETEAQGNFIGAGFQNMGKNIAWKNTEISYDAPLSADGRGGAKVDGAALIREVYYKEGAYKVSQMDSAAVLAMNTAHHEAKQRLNAANATLASGTADPDTIAAVTQQRDEAQLQVDQAKAVAETFMHDMLYNPALQAAQKDASRIIDIANQAKEAVAANPDNDAIRAAAIEADALAKQAIEKVNEAKNAPMPRQAGAQGAAALNEAVRQFAVNTGVYTKAPDNAPVAGPPDRSVSGSPQK